MRNFILLVPLEFHLLMLFIDKATNSLVCIFTCFNRSKYYCCKLWKFFYIYRKHYYYLKIGLFEKYKYEKEYDSKLIKINSYLKRNNYSNSYIKENINLNFPDDFPDQINNNVDDDKYNENMFYQDIVVVSQIYINNQRKEDLLDDFIEKLRKENEKCCCLKFRCFCLPACLIDTIFAIIVFMSTLLFFLFEGCYNYTFFNNFTKALEKIYDLEIKKDYLLYEWGLIFIINYIYYFVIFYCNFKRNYYKIYYPYYNGNYNEIGFLNLLKTIIDYFMITQYLVYFPAIIEDYKLTIKKYFVLLDFWLDPVFIIILKFSLPVLCFAFLMGCGCSSLTGLEDYLADQNNGEIIKIGYKKANEKGLIIEDDYEDHMFKELHLYSLNEDDNTNDNDNENDNDN